MQKNELKIVSGAQTGVDQGALHAAIDLGLDWGGWVPKGGRTENGVVGAIHQVEGRSFFKWNGEELLPTLDDGRTSFREGESVMVDRLVDGAVILQRQGGQE